MSVPELSSSRENSPRLAGLSSGRRQRNPKSILKDPSPRLSPKPQIKGSLVKKANNFSQDMPDIPTEDFSASEVFPRSLMATQPKRGPQWARLQQIKETTEISTDGLDTPRFEGKIQFPTGRHNPSGWLKPKILDREVDSTSTNNPGEAVETENLPLDDQSFLNYENRLEDSKTADAIIKVFQNPDIRNLLRNSKTMELVDFRGAGSAQSFKAGGKSFVLGSRLESRNSMTSIEGKSSMRSAGRFNKLRIFSSSDKLEHWLRYLFVAFYLAHRFSIQQCVESLLPYVRRMFKDLPSAGPAALIQTAQFSKILIGTLSELGE